VDLGDLRSDEPWFRATIFVIWGLAFASRRPIIMSHSLKARRLRAEHPVSPHKTTRVSQAAGAWSKLGAAMAITMLAGSAWAQSLVVNPATVSSTEGGASGTYTLELDQAPGAGLQVVVDISATMSQTSPSPTQVTFTDADWNVPVTITVDAIDDGDIETSPHAGQVTNAVNFGLTTEPAFLFVTENVAVDITDNDSVAILADPALVPVTEGGAAVTFDVELGSIPGAGTQVVIDVIDGTEADADVTQLTFTPADWNIPQPITVTVADLDDIAAGSRFDGITLSVNAATTDAAYGALPDAVVVFDIADNDVAGVTVTPTTINPTEGGVGVTYTVELDSEPAAGTQVVVESLMVPNRMPI
jgi:hypothetical protein